LSQSITALRIFTEKPNLKLRRGVSCVTQIKSRARTKRLLRASARGVILFAASKALLFFFARERAGAIAGDMVNKAPPQILEPTIFLQLQEEERQQMAHALMSGPGQILANTLMEVEYALPLLEQNPKVAANGLAALRVELRAGLTQLKELVAELQPPLLDEMGLGASMRQYIDKFGERTGLRVECKGCKDFHARYPRAIELALFRTLQEALANVDAHANATRVKIELTRGDAFVRLEIQDNGRGFAPRPAQIAKRRQLGLIIMRDRVELLGGQLKLFSEAGHGVRVLASIPYHGHARDSQVQGGQANDERNNHTAPRARPSHTRQEKTTRRPRRAKSKENTAR